VKPPPATWGLALVAILGCASEPSVEMLSPRAILEGHARGVHALAYSPDGKLFASAGGSSESGSDSISLWVSLTGEHRLTFANYNGVAASLAFSPDGKLLAVGGTEGRIALLEIETGTERLSFSGRPGRVACLAFSFDGKVLVSVSTGEGKSVEVVRWETGTGEARDSFTPEAAPAVALAPEGMNLAWPVSEEVPGIRVLDLETRKSRFLSKISVGQDDPVIFSPDGKWLAAVHLEDWNPFPNRCPYLYLVDAAGGRIRLRSPRAFGARRGLAISHNGRLLARGIDRGVELWDLKTLEVQATVDESWQKSEGAELLLFSPDDQTLLSSDGRGQLLLWEVGRLRDSRRD
jgi:WD40 repeat protein